MTLSYLCAGALVSLAAAAGRLGANLVGVIVPALLVYLTYKSARRQRFLSQAGRG